MNTKYILLILMFLSYQVLGIEFNPERGIYTNSQEIELVGSGIGIIYYTLDGSIPTPGETQTYTYDENEKIRINKTTTIRAREYRTEELNTDEEYAELFTSSYIFPESLLQDSEISSSLRYFYNQPEVSFAQYESDFREKIKGTFETHGVAVVSNKEFSADKSFSSLELFVNIDDQIQKYQINCDGKYFGGSSMRPPKKNMRFYFNKKYGEDKGKLRAKLFKKSSQYYPAEKFDQIILRGGSNDNQFFTHYGLMRGTYSVNRFFNQTMHDLGYPAPHGRFVHLILNGKYWGVYHLQERPIADFMKRYMGGEKEDYTALKSRCSQSQGNDNTCLNNVTALDGNIEQYRDLRNASKSYDEVIEKFDLDNFFDYMILNIYGQNSDWRHDHNWAAAGNIDSGKAPFYFIPWDSDFTFFQHNRVVTSFGPGWKEGLTREFFINNILNMSEDKRLKREIKLHFFDRLSLLTSNSGVLGKINLAKRFQNVTKELHQMITLEYAKWAPSESESFTRYTEWLENTSYLHGDPLQELNLETLEGTYSDLRMPHLKVLVKNRFSDVDVPYIAPPKLSHRSGIIEPATPVRLSASWNDNQKIYYTLNGQDPRNYNNEPSIYAEETTPQKIFEINEPTRIKARVRNGNNWSGLIEGNFIPEGETQYASKENILITKIHYHPTENKFLEFIEIWNSSDSTVNLNGFRIQGTNPDDVFGQIDRDYFVAPKERVIFANNPLLYKSHRLRQKLKLRKTKITSHYIYLWEDNLRVIPQVWKGNLSNKGQTFYLYGKNGNQLFRISYQDSKPEQGQLPWPNADGNDHLLSLKNPLSIAKLSDEDRVLALNHPDNWEAQPFNLNNVYGKINEDMAKYFGLKVMGTKIAGNNFVLKVKVPKRLAIHRGLSIEGITLSEEKTKTIVENGSYDVVDEDTFNLFVEFTIPLEAEKKFFQVIMN